MTSYTLDSRTLFLHDFSTEVICNCDVVLHDRLVPAEIVNLAVRLSEPSIFVASY